MYTDKIVTNSEFEIPQDLEGEQVLEYVKPLVLGAWKAAKDNIFAVGRCLYKLVESFLSPINPLLVHHQLIETAVLERVIKKLLKAGIQPIEGFLQSQHELGLVSFHGLICF